MDNRTHNQHPVWLVEQNPLAAEYLIRLLSRDRTVHVRCLEKELPQPEDIGSRSVFVLDRVGFEPFLTDFLRHLSLRIEHPRYIVLDKSFNVQQVLELLSFGVQGFLTHEETPHVLKSAIHSAIEGRMWINPMLMKECSQPVRNRRAQVLDGEEALTGREGRIMELAQQRFSNKEIAEKLNIEVSTVKFHLSNIFSKLRIASRSDLWKNSSCHLITQGWNRTAEVHSNTNGRQLGRPL